MPGETTSKEIVFGLDKGMDVYSPAISSQTLGIASLQNVSPRNRRLVTREGLNPEQTLGSTPIRAFPWYLNVNTNETRIYATSEDAVYYLDNDSNSFLAVPNGSLTGADTQVAFVPWYDRIYITKLGQPLMSLRDTRLEVIDSSWQRDSGNTSARYAIDADNHLYLANLTEGINSAPTRVRWSDLKNPENFEVSRATEADFFDLEASDTEITGLSKQRGYIIIYTRSSIWRAQYIGLPSIFSHIPIFNEIGNVFHNSVIRDRGRDFFIGEDNFYLLDGLNLTQIGDPIWKFFESDLGDDFEFNDYVYGYLDKQNMECIWIYRPEGSTTFSSVVYNYKERKWSVRDEVNITAVYASKYKPKVAGLMSDYTDSANDPTWTGRKANGDWQFYQYPHRRIAGTATGGISSMGGKAATSAFRNSPRLETYELDFNSLEGVKEVGGLTLLYKGNNNPPVFLTVRTRLNQNQPFTTFTPINVLNSIPGETKFYFDHLNVAGKFISFIITWTNTTSTYIDEIYKLSLDVRGIFTEKVER